MDSPVINGPKGQVGVFRRSQETREFCAAEFSSVSASSQQRNKILIMIMLCEGLKILGIMLREGF